MNFLSRWFGKRKTEPVTGTSAVIVQQEDYATPVPPGTGWRMWQYVSDDDMLHLYTADSVEAWHSLWAGPKIINPRSMQPTMNVNGLWWRPVP